MLAVRMAEWSKAPDSRTTSLLSDREWLWEFWSSMRAWVWIPLLTKLFFSKHNQEMKKCLPAPGEARTHGLQIMRLTRCLLRYGGLLAVQDYYSFWMYKMKWDENASAGNRTRVNCLEGSYAHHYTTDAFFTILLCTPKWKPQIHICLVTSTLKEKQRAIKLFTLCNKFPWCSGYHICLTRRRSPVRSRTETESHVV